MIFTTLTAFALVMGAAAQTTIQVGGPATGNIFQYSPNTVTAKNGTVVTFVFSGVPGNHSITQSAFNDPCNPLSGGFDSGWLLITETPSVAPTWNLTITDDTKPIWFYCKQTLPMPHCAAGMVGAINPPTSGANTFANFQANATKFAGTPGQGAAGQLVGIGASASAPLGPVPTAGATAFGQPTGTGTTSGGASTTQTSPATGSNTSGAASPTNTSSASSVVVNLLSVIIAGAIGLIFV